LTVNPFKLDDPDKTTGEEEESNQTIDCPADYASEEFDKQAGDANEAADDSNCADEAAISSGRRNGSFELALGEGNRETEDDGGEEDL
jgi:hypothetical protein